MTTKTNPAPENEAPIPVSEWVRLNHLLTHVAKQRDMNASDAALMATAVSVRDDAIAERENAFAHLLTLYRKRAAEAQVATEIISNLFPTIAAELKNGNHEAAIDEAGRIFDELNGPYPFGEWGDDPDEHRGLSDGEIEDCIERIDFFKSPIGGGSEEEDDCVNL